MSGADDTDTPPRIVVGFPQLEVAASLPLPSSARTLNVRARTEIQLMEQTCGNCRAFLLQDKNTGAGICRAHPPTVLAGELHVYKPTISAPGTPAYAVIVQNIAGQNPPTTRDLWCREWDEAYVKSEAN